MAVIIPPNYFSVPSEVIVQGKLFTPDDTGGSLTRGIPSNAFSDLSPISGITNLTITFNLNTGTFRGLGDFVQFRKPISWEASLEMTRFITDRHDSIVNIFKLMHEFENDTNGFLFGRNLVGRYVMSVLISIPNDELTGYLNIYFIGSLNNISISGERGKVEETISLVAYSNGSLYTGFSSGGGW